MSLQPVTILGAGPSGLSAAIELARNDVPVTVYEQHHRVGRRFHGDYQGFENWTTEQDVLDWLEEIGIALDCPIGPVEEVTLVDPTLRPTRVRARRPLLYLVKRGSEPDSLDRALLAQAHALGVRVVFGRRVRPERLDGPVIVATGPRETQAVVAGIIAETSHADQIVAIAHDSLAPKCYAYCVIWQGRATVAAALARDFHLAWPCFERAKRAFAQLGLHDFRRPRRFGGRANIFLRDALSENGRVYVGEAAGLQDFLLGFGMRYALLSGHLAARSLLTGKPYEQLLARHLGDGFRAGFVNRMLYNRIGNAGYRFLIRWLSRAPDVSDWARRVYSFTPLHRALWPVAKATARRADGGEETGRPGVGPRATRRPADLEGAAPRAI
jgi:flavin-dependent dehydrogenase